MSKYIIHGGNALSGTVRIHGAKNAALPLLAASVLNEGESVIHDCPRLSDVAESLEILNFLGCSAHREGNTVIVNSKTLLTDEIPERLMLKMRSSVIFLGALIARCKSGKVTLPGGCEIGPRPIDLHLKAFRAMGIDIEECGGIISCQAGNLHGANIHLDFPSVGATENIMLAATGAKGRTVISNAAKEPEIIDLQNYLNHAGFSVHGAGSDTVCIDGGRKGISCEHTVIPDRIEAATYAAAALLTGGNIRMDNVRSDHMEAFLAALRESHAHIEASGNTLYVASSGRLSAVKRIRTHPYPGFPTDMQSLFMSLMTTAKGSCMITETIFCDRFHPVDGLVRMGADITTDGSVALVRGVKGLYGAHVLAGDLRGGAALTIAALAAQGESVVENVCYIDRGYEAFEENLSLLGADIQRK